jgi:spore germination protein KB
MYPKLPLTGYLKEILGRWIGWPLGVLYVLFFIHGAARDLREGGELLVSSVLDQTPVIAVMALMIISIVYVLNKGIEVLARTGQIFIAVLIILAVITNFLLWASGIVEINRLLPVLGKGWGPVLKTTLTQTFEFPYEEVICFTMLLPYLNQQKRGIQAGFAAVLFSSVILSLSTAMNIAVLGTDMAGRATFPLLHTVSLINIGEIIQRLDVIVVLTLIIGVFFKVAILFYGGVLAASDLFQISDYRRLVYPLGIIILSIAMMLSGNFTEQIEEGDVLLVTVFLFFGVVIPGFLLVVGGLRRRSRPSR